MMETARLFALLLMGHALADFALQSDVMAKGKNRHNKTKPPPGAKCQVCWPYWMVAHGLIHGITVYWITGTIVLGLAETVCHSLIDALKCENITNVHVDQSAHIITKLCWCVCMA